MTKQKTPKADTPLLVGIEDEQLVIRVGINTIAFAAENGPEFQRYNERTGDYDKLYHVADAAELARDVVRALTKEQEDGTTPVHVLLDNAIEFAYDDGSLGFREDGEEQ